MENDGQSWGSYEEYLSQFDTQCTYFEGNVDIYYAYDPTALDWGGEMALFDPNFAMQIPQVDFGNPAFMPNPADIWGDMDAGFPDPWMMPPEFAFAMPHPQVDFASFTPDFETHGTPLEDLSVWQEQDHPYSCAVATTDMILDGYGLDFSEADIAQIFTDAGIYDPESGTAPTEIDETLNALFQEKGIALEAVQMEGFTVSDLEGMLDNGVRPLIALDAMETWPGAEPCSMKEAEGIPEAGHAVQLTGIIDTPAGKMVVLNDPGIPDGAGLTVPIEKFMDACADFGNLAIAVQPSTATATA